MLKFIVNIFIFLILVFIGVGLIGGIVVIFSNLFIVGFILG